MSRSQKIVLIALALIALAFVALVVRGQMRPSCEGRDADCAKGYEPGDTMRFFGKLLSDASPKVKLPQPRYTVQDKTRLSIDIAPADDKIRTLKVRLTQGTARLNVVSAPGDKGDIDLADQAKPTGLPREASAVDDQRTLSFVVTRGGGVLTVDCAAGPCVIENG